MPSWRSSTIARGRVASLDVAAAKAHPGRRRGDHAREPPAACRSTRTSSTACSASASKRCRTIACAMPSSPSPSSSPRRWRPRPRARACSPRPMRQSPRGSDSTAASAYDPPAVGIGSPARFRSRRSRRRPCRGRAADRDGVRDPDPVSQRDGAACHRRRMGRRPADHRYAEPGHRDGAGGFCGLFRHSGRERAVCAARFSAAASGRRRS